jgi:hypothetical protein
MSFTTERVSFTSQRPFDDVVEGIYQGIGRPDLEGFLADLAATKNYDEYRAIVRKAVGPSDLMRFLQLDDEPALAINPDIEAFRLIRIIAGNPLTMSEMTRYVPDAGTYAPVTILAYQARDGVHVSYDTVVSALGPYGDERALRVAEDLDRKVLTLLDAATSGGRLAGPAL